MKIFKKNIGIVLSIEIFLILLFASALIFPKVYTSKKKILPPPYLNSFNPSLEKRLWKTYMNAVGTQQAYLDFLQVYKNAPYTIQHPTMHIIGGLIYELDGIKGITTCNDAMSYGCYHGFFTSAIKETGISKIKKMDQACSKKFGSHAGGCQHGIGHGLMMYLGKGNLIKALDFCNKHNPFNGCQNGVFMEYNFSTFSHASIPVARSLDISNPYFPCNTIPKKYQASCYYELPNWWENVYKKNYEKIGELCENLPNDYKEICYFSTGNIASKHSNFVLSEVTQKCDAIKSQYGTIACRAGARSSYKVRKRKEAYEILCDSTAVKDLCIKISQSQLKSTTNDIIFLK